MIQKQCYHRLCVNHSLFSKLKDRDIELLLLLHSAENCYDSLQDEVKEKNNKNGNVEIHTDNTEIT